MNRFLTWIPRLDSVLGSVGGSSLYDSGKPPTRKSRYLTLEMEGLGQTPGDQFGMSGPFLSEGVRT